MPNPTSGAVWEPGFKVRSSSPFEPGIGGNAVCLKAGGALKVGDAVYVSADETVNKSTGNVAGNWVGVVVGGEATRLRTQPEVPTGADAATAAGQLVIVAIQGSVAEAVADGALAVGSWVKFSTTTAGRLVQAADLGIAAGSTAVTSSAANGDIVSGDGRRKILGMALTATSAAGQKFKVLIGG